MRRKTIHVIYLDGYEVVIIGQYQVEDTVEFPFIGDMLPFGTDVGRAIIDNRMVGIDQEALKE